MNTDPVLRRRCILPAPHVGQRHRWVTGTAPMPVLGECAASEVWESAADLVRRYADLVTGGRASELTKKGLGQ